MATDSVRVAVFIDWQNVYRSAREAFGLESLPGRYGNFSPYRIACLLAAANGRSRSGSLVAVEIFRGVPSPSHDPIGHAANRRQAAAWEAEFPGVVVPKLRPLRYSGRGRAPVEKGVDVELAVGAIEATLRRRCDVAIVFSHDSDLLPVPEAIARLAGRDRVETASWSSPTFEARLRPRPAVVHHQLRLRAFREVETPVNFARR